MPFSAVQKTVFGLVATALIFLLVVSANGLLSYRINEVKNWTLHTHQVIEELKDALLALEDVESGDRGFALTGNDDFLASYESGRESVLKSLDRVSYLTEDNPVQHTLVAKAKREAIEKLRFADAVLKTNDPDRAKDLLNQGDGRKIMTCFKQTIAAMDENEEALLCKRSADLVLLQKINWIATAILGLCTVILLWWIYQVAHQAIAEEQKRILDLESEIIERKKIEKKLLVATARLTSSNTDLQQFAYVASHDLQEPLRAVAGFLTLIESKNKGKIDPDTQAWIGHAVDGAQRMRTLINDLLRYAQVDSQGKELKLADCNAALHMAKKNLALLLDETEAELISDNLPQVMADEGQLAQLFQNLIANAVKFKGIEKPRLIIRAVQRQGEWILSIQDNGIGFEEEHAKRIFVIFQRLHGRDEYRGTGIGLALCKKIVERHGGRIWAKSEPGKGATFYFTFPVASGGDSD